MGFPIRLRPQVESEVVEAMAWYGGRATDLDREFYGAFLDADLSLDSLRRPEKYPLVSRVR